jgi:hypothetical protein
VRDARASSLSSPRREDHSDRPGALHDTSHWAPPQTARQAADLVVTLTNEVSLILAQLAEAPAAWCRRTGRTLEEYQDWRQRALIAKAYKENQLRECKRLRHELGESGDALAEGPLHDLCVRLLVAWRRGGTGHNRLLDEALLELADHLGVHIEVIDSYQPAPDADLLGVAAAARARESA